MFSRSSARLAAIAAACEYRRFLTFGALLAATMLGGCQAAAPAVASADPADPSVSVSRVAYRSTIAPYSSLRPTVPTQWRERNDAVSPKRKGAGDER